MRKYKNDILQILGYVIIDLALKLHSWQLVFINLGLFLLIKGLIRKGES